MTVQFIGQGYNFGANTSVAQVLIEALQNNTYHTFKCMVAFASPSGVSGLTQHVNNSRVHIQNTRVIIGIDQNATSRDALESLLQWDADSYIFFTVQRNIFHPKVYIFEGENEVLIIIGSNNLTQMGLARNIEASVVITFNKANIGGANLLDQITTYFDPLLTGENANLQPLTQELINQLVAAGIVPTEPQRRAKYVKDIAEAAQQQNNGFAAIQALFPGIGFQGLPADFAPQLAAPVIIAAGVPAQVIAVPNPAPVAINNPGWQFTDQSQVLVAEIGGPARWKQISFAKDNFQTFFGLPVTIGTSGQISLKYIEDNGTIQNQIEQCISARVKASKNFNLEPIVVRGSAVPYNHANRPIIFFIKINATNFIYHFETFGSQRHIELQQLFPARVGNTIRRRVVTVADLRVNCPSVNL